MCYLQQGIRSNEIDDFEIHRSIECVCTSEFWGFNGSCSLFLIEASDPNDYNGARSRVDLAVLKVSTSFSGVWTPFKSGGPPVFGETPSSSWVHSLAFGKPLPNSVIIKASSASFNYSVCVLCDSLPKGDQLVIAGLLPGTFRRGLHFKGALAHMVPRPNGKFGLLGLERMFSEIRAGTQIFEVEAQLAIFDCLWQETQNIEWKLTFNGTIPFHPVGSLVVADTVVIKLTGIREHENFYADVPLTAYLKENDAFNLTSRFRFFQEDVMNQEAPFNGVANTSQWVSPFHQKWLVFDNVDFLIVAVQLRSIFGINITYLTFNGTGSATFINDPWTARGDRAQVAIDFRGSSGKQFPHVSSEVNAYLTTPDPAAVVRTLMQHALSLNYSNPTCGTTAGQDLLFDHEQIRIVLSTWDSEFFGMEVPSRDARSHSCVTTNGNVPSGTPCHFPFEYNGQIFSTCTRQDWHTSWCSTTPVYSGHWGECVCDKLRRGVQLNALVRLYEGGPLLTLNADGVQDVIQGINFGGGLRGVNGTLKMYFPIFDSDSSNDLEMLVMLVPRDASRCLDADKPKALPIVGKSPSGACERLGYITDWLGEPGDESTLVCRHPDELFPSGMSSQFVAAATQSLLGLEASDSPPYFSSFSPVDQVQACMDVGLTREISLCSAEKFRTIPVAAPELFGRHFCFWTDTSKNPGLEEHKFAQCAVCQGPSCTAKNEPLRAWQLEDRVCYRFPCVP
jgi:hypothetical protein